MKPRIIFFGNERLSTGYHTYAPTLRGLIKNGYEVVAVVAHHTEAQSRKRRLLEVQSIAEEHKIPLFLSGKPTDILHKLRELKPTIGVLVAYGKIIPEEVINLFPKGIINIHPSLLPHYRGATPIEQAILDGASKSGVSLMQLVKEMDAGPVYASQTIDIPLYESKENLTNALLGAGVELLLEKFSDIHDGSLQPEPQNEADATYCRQIEKEDGILDWSKAAKQLEREIRAYAAWPRSRTTFGSISVIVTSASVSQENIPQGEVIRSENNLLVGTSSGSLAIHQLIPEGKKEMPVQAFLAGYGSRIT